MPLVPSVLESALAEHFAGPARDPASAAQDLAAAYLRYARSAAAGAFPWVPTGTEGARMAAAMAPCFVPVGDPVRFALALANAIQVCWLAPPAIFGPGLVSVFAGYPALAPALASILAVPKPAAVAAAAMATALDAATRTVVVVYPVLGPFPLV